MSAIYTYGQWIDIVDRGTSGDQVMDILASWKVDAYKLLEDNHKLEAELARRDEKIAELLKVYGECKDAIARRDEELGLTEKKLCNIDRLAMEEIARRDELIQHKEEVIGHIKEREKNVFELLSNTIKRRNKKIAEQADTIRKLKEDGERLASTYVIEVFPHEWVCRGGCHHWARFGEQIEHSPDCPITLHRALMKELE